MHRGGDRSNSLAGTFGFWMCSAKACGCDSRLMASAIGTLRRPMEMIRRGQGASSVSLAATQRSSRAGGNRSCSGAGTNFIAPVTRARLRLNGRPTASATAMPCASIPTEPSVMIQVFSPRAFWLLAIRAAASSGAEFLERLALNFFSILLAERYKIARRVPQRSISLPPF